MTLNKAYLKLSLKNGMERSQATPPPPPLRMKISFNEEGKAK
jgi:hypothetical protein